MSLRFHLFVSDISQLNEDFDCKKVGSRFSSLAPGMEEFSLDLPRAVKKSALGGMLRCVEFVVAG